MPEQIRAKHSSSGVSDQQSVGLSPNRDTCVLNQDTFMILRMGHKAVGPVCCVTHEKEPSALSKKRRGLPWCSWSDWQHIVPVAPCMPLHGILKK